MYTPDSLGPDELVQPCVNAHVLCAHLLGGKLTNFFDCTGGSFLETNIQEPFVHVDGVHSGNHFIDRRFAFTFPC